MKTGFLLVLGLIWAMPGVAAEDSYPEEDFKVYQQAIWVRDSEVQQAAISALAHYPQGMDLLEEFIRKEPRNDNVETAIRKLKTFAKHEKFEERILRLRKVLREKVRESASEEQEPSRKGIIFANGTVKVVERLASPPAEEKVARKLTHLLFNQYPKKYAGEMTQVIFQHLAEEGTQISFGDGALDDLLLVAVLVDKKQLYPLVPLLIEDLNAFFDDPRAKAYRALIVITGEAVPFEKDGTETERQEVMEKYREIYSTKLKDAK